MDESLTAVWVRGNLVNQQCLSVSDRDSSPSVPQQGILCGDSNMLEALVRDNRPLNVFDVQSHETPSMLFPYEQEMTHDGLLSKGASEESTASARCPSAPSSVECTDQPSGASTTLLKNKRTGEFLANNGSDATGIHSCSVVRLTCKNAIIQCLQHKTNILSHEIFDILSERFLGKNGKPKYSKRTIQRTLSVHKNTFVHEGKPVYSIGAATTSEYWHLKEYKVGAMNDSVVVGSIDNNPVCAKDPEVPDCKNKTFTKILEVSGYKNEIIECLLHGGAMSVKEISESMTMRRKNRNINDKVNKSSINNVLLLHQVIFKPTLKIDNPLNKKDKRWFMEEHVKKKFLSSEWSYSINPIAPINYMDTPPVFPKDLAVPVCKKKFRMEKIKAHSCIHEIIECLRRWESLSLKEICEKINLQRQYRNLHKKIAKETVVRLLARHREIFKRTNIKGNTKEGRWSIRESVKKKLFNSEGLASINSIGIPPIVSDVELDTYPAMLCRCFKDGKVLTLLEVYAAIFKQHPDINDMRPLWRQCVRRVLQSSNYFQWSQSYKGVSNDEGFWRMKKSMNNYVESDEQLESLNVTPPFPIIQPRLSPIASGEEASAMASPMDHSAGMVSIDHDNKLPSEWLCRSEEGGFLGESLTNEGQFFSQENFLLLQQILESEVGKTQTIEECLVGHGGGVFENELCDSATCSDTSVQKNNLERISGDEFIECVNSGEDLTHNKYDENMEEQDSYSNKNEHEYFGEYVERESKKLAASSFRHPSVENENNLGGDARPAQFGCILGSTLIGKGYNDVNME